MTNVTYDVFAIYSPNVPECIEWVAGQVSPQKKIRRVEFVEQIPKSLSGKILRRILVEQERAQVAT